MFSSYRQTRILNMFVVKWVIVFSFRVHDLINNGVPMYYIYIIILSYYYTNTVIPIVRVFMCLNVASNRTISNPLVTFKGDSRFVGFTVGANGFPRRVISFYFTPTISTCKFFLSASWSNEFVRRFKVVNTLTLLRCSDKWVFPRCL